MTSACKTDGSALNFSSFDLLSLFGGRLLSPCGSGAVSFHHTHLGHLPEDSDPDHRHMGNRRIVGAVMAPIAPCGGCGVGALCGLRLSGQYQTCVRYALSRPCDDDGVGPSHPASWFPAGAGLGRSLCCRIAFLALLEDQPFKRKDGC